MKKTITMAQYQKKESAMFKTLSKKSYSAFCQMIEYYKKKAEGKNADYVLYCAESLSSDISYFIKNWKSAKTGIHTEMSKRYAIKK